MIPALPTPVRHEKESGARGAGVPRRHTRVPPRTAAEVRCKVPLRVEVRRFVRILQGVEKGRKVAPAIAVGVGIVEAAVTPPRHAVAVVDGVRERVAVRAVGHTAPTLVRPRHRATTRIVPARTPQSVHHDFLFCRLGFHFERLFHSTCQRGHPQAVRRTREEGRLPAPPLVRRPLR